MYFKKLYFIIGVLCSSICLYIFFGCEIKCNTEPNIKINIPPFIVNSKIIIFEKHIHHWIIGLIFLFISFIISILVNSDLVYFVQSFSIVLILHGLLYQDCFDL